jgi:hypothetical protein
MLTALAVVAACEPRIPRGSYLLDKFPDHPTGIDLSWPENLPSHASLRLVGENNQVRWEVKKESERWLEAITQPPEAYFSTPTVECETALNHVVLFRSSARAVPYESDEKTEIFRFESRDVSFAGHCGFHRKKFSTDENGELTRDEDGFLDVELVPIDPHWKCMGRGTIKSATDAQRVSNVAIYFPLELLADISTQGF